MKRFKNLLTLILLVFAVNFSVDLHGLSHVFESEHEDESNTCELCIFNHQKEQNNYALEPSQVCYEYQDLTNIDTRISKINSSQTSPQTFYLIGQLFNRPPPSYV